MIISFDPRSTRLLCIDRRADVKIPEEGRDDPSRLNRRWVGNPTRSARKC